MKSSKNLNYLEEITHDNINELWKNVFEGKENDEYINRYVPIPVPGKSVLEQFMINKRNYSVWLIQREKQKDIIGFLIHGDFWPGTPNNIGLNIGLKYCGKGYGTEAIESLINHLKDSEYKETFGLCFEENNAIRKVMEKNGFVNLGRTGNTARGFNEVKYKLVL